MSDGDIVGYPILKVKVDGSDVIPSLRSILSQAQAEVDQRVVRMSAGINSPGGTASTFSSIANGTATRPNAYASAGGFAVNVPSGEVASVMGLMTGPQLGLNRVEAQSLLNRVSKAYPNMSTAEQLIPAMLRAHAGESLPDAASSEGTPFQQTEGRSARRSMAAASGTSRMSPEQAAAESLSAQRNKALYDREFDRFGNQHTLNEDDLVDRPVEHSGHRFNPLQIVGYSLAGIHEASRVNRALDAGDYDIAMASTPADVLRATMRQTEQAWSGVGGSLGGAALDLVGAGPESYIARTRKDIGLLDARDANRRQSIDAPFRQAARDAISNRDDFAGQRNDVNRRLADLHATNDPQIQQTEETLRNSYRDVSVPIYGPTRQSAAYSGALAAGYGMGSGTTNQEIVGYSTKRESTIDDTVRSSLNEKLKGLKKELDEARKDAATAIEKIGRDVADARRGLGVSAAAGIARSQGNSLQADFIELAGRNNEVSLKTAGIPELREAGIAQMRANTSEYLSDLARRSQLVGRGFREQISGTLVASLRAQGNFRAADRVGLDEQEQQEIESNEDRFRGLGFVGRSLTAGANYLTRVRFGSIRTAEGNARGIEQQSYGTDLKARQGIVAAERDPTLNPFSRSAMELARGTRSAEFGILADTSLDKGERNKRARSELQLGADSLDNLQRNYLNGFRGQQIDLRNIDTTNRQDKENPAAVVNEIKQLKNDLLQAIKDLGSD